MSLESVGETDSGETVRGDTPVLPTSMGARSMSSRNKVVLKKFCKIANAAKGVQRLQSTGFEKCHTAERLQRPRPGNADGQSVRPVFGDIQFANGQTSRYCVISDNEDAAPVLLENAMGPDAWNLELPRLLLSIMGGAGNMDLDPAIEKSFSEGLVRVAKQTGAWVITGATDSGVMGIAGKAMAAHDKKRTVPLIGIASYGSLKSQWRESLDDPKNDQRSGVIRIVDAPTVVPIEGEGMLAAPQTNHSHFIFCDSGQRGKDAFGKESKFRAKFEWKVGLLYGKKGESAPAKPVMRRRYSSVVMGRTPSDAIPRTPSGRVPTQEAAHAAANPCSEALRVMILVNGGPISFDMVGKTLEGDCPVVVCRNSGRAADFLAALHDKYHGGGGVAAMDETARHDAMKEAWEKHMTAPADKKVWEDNYSKPEVQEKLEETIQNELLCFYCHTERLEDVVIGAVLKSIRDRHSRSENYDELRDSLQRSLDLAVRWQCTKHCRDLFTRLVDMEKKAFSKMPVEDEEQNMSDEDLSFFESAAWTLRQMTGKSWVEADPSHLIRLWFECYPVLFKKFPMECLTSQQVPTLLENAREESMPRLMIWLIENGAPLTVVDALWLQQENPAHAALAAAHAFRNAAEKQSRTEDNARFVKAGDRYEQLAIDFINGLGFDSVDPVEYLFRMAPEWDNRKRKNLATFAHDLECKDFVNEQFYLSAVNLLWFTPHPFEEHHFGARGQKNLKNFSPVELVVQAFTYTFSSEKQAEHIMTRDSFWAVPKIKAMTQFLFRSLFILTYSVYVLYSSGVTSMVLSLLLVFWGVALGLVEFLQFMEGSLQDYISSLWNLIDLLIITVLLAASFSEWFLVPIGLFRSVDIHVLHALNLLPCYLRLLQMLELSVYFGTLLITVVDMFKDTFNFFILLSIVGMGFSCALTPILYPNADDRWSHSMFWTFWAIFGDTGEDAAMPEAKDRSVFGLRVLPFLRYGLYLTMNVLLVNLLIAMLSDTYGDNKEKSKRIWGFQCSATVLEFASDSTHALPPPLDILVSARAIADHYRKKPEVDKKKDDDGTSSVDLDEGTASGQLTDIEKSIVVRQLTRQERRSMNKLQQKLLSDLSDPTTKDESEKTAESLIELEGRLRMQVEKVDKLLDCEKLRKEIDELKKTNKELVGKIASMQEATNGGEAGE